MKKNRILFITLFLMNLAYAQQSELGNFLNRRNAAQVYLQSHSAQNFWAHAANEEQLVTYLLQTLPELQHAQSGLRLLSMRESTIGRHYLFAQTFNGLDVYAATLKVNTSKNGKILSVFSCLFPSANWNDEAAHTNPSGNEKAVWIYNGNNLQKGFVKTAKEKELLLSPNREILFETSLSLGAGKRDTLLPVKLFNPDPLSTAHVAYGAPYANNNKQDVTELNAQRKDVMMKLRINDQDTFLTENEYVMIRDIYSPVVAPFSSKNAADFITTRATNLFKMEMAMFHVQKYQEYLQSLGFSGLVNYQLHIDPLGDLFENSRFVFDTPPFFMILAVGGIPDAEDADGVVHEYTHAVSHWQAPYTANGHQRLAVEEGNADAIACIYSHRLDAYNWRRVFNWDGNETWYGRNANSSKTYADTSGSNFYSDCEIWSSTMLDIAEAIGHDVFMKILLTSMPSYQNFISMPQAAELFLQADSILYNKMHYGQINTVFVNRKIFSVLDVTTQSTTLPVLMKNSEAFASGNGPLQIQTGSTLPSFVQLFDINGRLVWQEKYDDTNFFIESRGLKSGLYSLLIQSGKQKFNAKLVKYAE